MQSQVPGSANTNTEDRPRGRLDWRAHWPRQEHRYLGWLLVAAFLEPNDGAFTLQRVPRLRIVHASGLYAVIDDEVQCVDQEHLRALQAAEHVGAYSARSAQIAK
jgi:hypothetical protein